MSWRSGGAWDESWGGSNSVEGVELSFVCRGIPVLTMDTSSVFHENASWMIQSALGASGKADALYEYFDSEDIYSECCRLGFSRDELSLVRLKERRLRHVVAVGTTGKRSVMLAIVLALALQDDNEENLSDLWKDLDQYKLTKAFWNVLKSSQKGIAGKPSKQRGRQSDRSDRRRQPDDSAELEGVDVEFVCDSIPVTSLEKESVFHENVSWLLQTVTETTGKADALYHYFNDKDILRECRQMNLSDQDVLVARMKRDDLRDVKAVGITGKRSLLLSLFISMLMEGKVDFDTLMTDVEQYDPDLKKPCIALIRRTTGTDLSELEQGGRKGKRRRREEDEDDWSQWDYSYSRKNRKYR